MITIEALNSLDTETKETLVKYFFNYSEMLHDHLIKESQYALLINSISMKVDEIDEIGFTILVDLQYEHITTKLIHNLIHTIEISYKDTEYLCKSLYGMINMVGSEIGIMLEIYQTSDCEVECINCDKRYHNCTRGRIVDDTQHKDKP